jgi:hypothetical protein
MPSVTRQIDHVGEIGEKGSPSKNGIKQGYKSIENNQKDDLIGVQFGLRLPVSDPVLGI